MHNAPRRLEKGKCFLYAFGLHLDGRNIVQLCV